MRIDVAALAAEGLRYVSPRDAGGTNEVVLGRSGGLTGTYEHSAAGHAVDARATSFELLAATWHVGSGKVTAQDPARLGDVTLRLDVPRGDAPTRIALQVETLAVGRVHYASEHFSFAADLHIEGLVVDRGVTGNTRVKGAAAVLREVELRAGSVKVRANVVRTRGFSLTSTTDSTRVAAEGLQIDELEVEIGDIRMASRAVALELGISWEAGHLEVGSLEVGALAVSYPVPPPRVETGTDAAAALGAALLPDIPALDRLEGRVAVGVSLRATLPILKERSLAHTLVVPIEDGTISFGDLEDGLPAVADALLDFEVEGDTLRLELDVVPVVTFDNVTLVSWKLPEPRDRELAADHRIRLRRLLQLVLPPRKEPKPNDERGSFRLLAVDVDPIAIDLSAKAPMTFEVLGGRVDLDDGSGHAVGALSVQGALHVPLEGPPAPGELRASARGIVASLEALRLGDSRLGSARLSIGHVDSVVVTLEGTRPTRITADLSSLRLTALAWDSVGATS